MISGPVTCWPGRSAITALTVSPQRSSGTPGGAITVMTLPPGPPGGSGPLPEWPVRRWLATAVAVTRQPRCSTARHSGGRSCSAAELRYLTDGGAAGGIVVVRVLPEPAGDEHIVGK